VPEFPEKEHPITLRHLARHEGGIRHYRGDEALSNRHYAGVVDALSVFADDPLVAEPGTTFSYSTYGFTLLSAAMERAAGMPFLTLMEERVLEPLGMTRTGPEVKGQLHPDQARGYEPAPGGGAVVPPETDLSNKWAGGGFLSTAPDLVSFASAHMDGSFLEPATTRLFWTPQKTLDGEETGYGIGWNIMERDGRRVVYHTGGATGGSDVLVLLPDEGVAVAVLTNLSSQRPTEAALAIAEAFLASGG